MFINNGSNIPQNNSMQQNPTPTPHVKIPPQVLQDMQQQTSPIPAPQTTQQQPDTMTPPQATQQQETARADTQQQSIPTTTGDETKIAAMEAQQVEADTTAQDDPQAAQDTQEQTVPTPPADAWNYFTLGWFAYHVAHHSKYANRQTGFPNLDIRQAFFPGFYVVGAVSSLGKTTFCHQLADQLAAKGEYVLYFSLEQTQLEMYSKSLSRELYLEYLRTPGLPTYSSIEIRNGIATSNHPIELQNCINAYIQSVGDRMRVIAPETPPNIEWIQREVENFIRTTGQTPVVIIDYLQIIRPSIVNKRPLEPRQSIDHIVTALKSMQKRFDMTIVAVSSLNRQNYTTPIDYESFKESGGIEYSADVVWGLQLAVIDKEDIFEKEGNITKKREAVKKAKAEIPRKIQLAVLKNRYGRANYTANFEYYPNYDVFFATHENPANPDWDDWNDWDD